MFAYPTSFQSLTTNADIVPEEAIHRSIAFFKQWHAWKLRLEGYWNSAYRLLDAYISYADLASFSNRSRRENFGGELMVSFTPANPQNNFFGWSSYTLGRNTLDKYLSEYDQTHVFKLVAGYLFGIHTVSLRFDLNSGFPYIPITGSYLSAGTVPEYFAYGDANAQAHFPMAHRLSLRYSQDRPVSWGSWRWYVEVINVTNYAPLGRQVFDSRQPYQAGVNPTLQPLEPKIPILPNFGVEIRF